MAARGEHSGRHHSAQDEKRDDQDGQGVLLRFVMATRK